MKYTAIILLVLVSLYYAFYGYSDILENNKITDKEKNNIAHMAPSTQVSEKIQLGECLEKTRLENKINELKYDRNNKLISKLTEMNVDKYMSEKTLAHYNVPLQDYRKKTAAYGKYNYNDLPPIKGKPHVPKGQLQDDLIKYHLTNNYKEIIGLIQSGQLFENSIIGGKSILSAQFILNKNLDIDTLRHLIESGLTPNFAALVEATSVGLSVEHINVMVSYDDVNKTWFNNYHQYTLAMLAVEKLNDELVDYWLSYDVPLVVRGESLTAMDILGEPKNREEVIKATNIFIMLANRDVWPFQLKKLDEIKRWLPEDAQKEFLTIDKVNELTGQKGEHPIKSIGALLDDIDKQIAKLEKCLPKKMHFNDSAEDMLAVEKKTSLQMFSEQSVEMRENILSLMSLAKNKHWDEYINEIDKLIGDSDNDDYKQLAIIDLINNDGPYSLIENLILDGATFPEQSIFSLIHQNNIKLIKELKALGLDLSVKTPEGLSALQFAAQNNANQELIEYLKREG